MLKLAENPDILHPATDDLSSIPGTWWVAQTKSRCEKAFATDLASRGIAYFLPMIQRLTFSGGRKRRGMMPLFAGYVFFCGSEVDRHTAADRSPGPGHRGARPAPPGEGTVGNASRAAAQDR